MNYEEVLENLCYYDRRNPLSVNHVDEDDSPYDKTKKCSCDNCFYGRTKLANHIIDSECMEAPFIYT